VRSSGAERILLEGLVDVPMDLMIWVVICGMACEVNLTSERGGFKNNGGVLEVGVRERSCYFGREMIVGNVGKN